MFRVFCCVLGCNGGWWGGGYFEMYCWKGLRDLELVMRVY